MCSEPNREQDSATVWVVQGWDEPPRGVFDSQQAARRFAEACDDFRPRDLAEDGSGHDCYPFIDEYEVNSV